MSDDIHIRALSERPEHAPLLAEWFRAEWPDYFRNWSKERIVAEYLTAPPGGDGLPLVIVAECDGKPCGTVMLRTEWRDSHRHLSPWVGGLYVLPAFRGRSVARRLISALAQLAAQRGFASVYAGTTTLGRFLKTLGWEYQEIVGADRASVAVFRWRPSHDRSLRHQHRHPDAR